MTATATHFRVARPDSGEYAPYYERYVGKVPDGDVVRHMEAQIRDTATFIRALPESRGGYRYAEGKWSIREVVGHLCDTERVFVYRAMRFARADETPLPGFDENEFVARSRFDNRTLASLTHEFEAVRGATVAFFEGLDADEWVRRGTANNLPMSVRALAWVVAGHELHHRGLLQTRYV
jgi:uncharacterized damage-inducible protein DinB